MAIDATSLRAVFQAILPALTNGQRAAPAKPAPSAALGNFPNPATSQGEDSLGVAADSNNAAGGKKTHVEQALAAALVDFIKSFAQALSHSANDASSKVGGVANASVSPNAGGVANASTSTSVGGPANVPVSPAGGAATAPPGVSGLNSTAPAKTTGDMGPGGNPSIVAYQGKYYSAQANFNSTVTITSSANLNDVIHGEGDQITYTCPTPNMKTESPNLSVVNDPTTGKQTLAMYTTNMNGPGAGSIDFSKLADPSNPAKGFVSQGAIAGISGYDPHLVSLPNGKSYLFTSNFQHIQATPLSNPWTAAAPSKNIITGPPGSQGAASLCEAPATVVSGNTLNLVYASGNYADSSYQSNVATVNIDDIMDPSSWKHSNQSFATSNGITGPGSGTFVNSGNQTWWVYGYIAGGSGPAGRHVRGQTVSFAPSGEVQLGQPE